DRHQAGLYGDTPARLLETVPGARDQKREHAGRATHCYRRNGCTRETCDVVADQRDDDHVWPRRNLRNGKTIGELPIAHPVHHIDGDAMHFRNCRVGAADCEQRQQREITEQRDERVFVHRLIHARAMLIGASTAKTSGSGHCMIATPTNAAIAMSGAQSRRLRNNGAAIFATTAISSPTAAAVMPARMRPSISISPNREPNTTEKLTTLGPGRNWDSANASLNSSAVIHPRWSTIMRRAHGSAPP